MAHHQYPTGQEIQGSDVVKLPGGTLGHIITPGADRSLVEFRNTTAHCDERDWFQNADLALDHSPKSAMR